MKNYIFMSNVYNKNILKLKNKKNNQNNKITSLQLFLNFNKLNLYKKFIITKIIIYDILFIFL